MVLSRLVSVFLLAAAMAKANGHDDLYNNAERQKHVNRAQRLAQRQNIRNFTLTDSAEGADFFECVAV